MAKTTVGVKLDDETRARLKTLGAIKDRSAHWLMREAIRRYIDAEERYEAEKADDEARYQEFLVTGSHISNERMMAWLRELEEAAGSSRSVE